MQSQGATAGRGSENLELMEYAPRYVAHIGSIVAESLPRTGEVVDFGAGDGSQTSAVMAPSHRLVCVDNDAQLRTVLENKGYQTKPSLQSFDSSSVDCVYSINCLEHIDDDVAVLNEVRRILRDNGTLVLFVPALQMLFSNMDSLVGHKRRYSRRELRSKVENAGFSVVGLRYVDSVGAILSFLYKAVPGASGRPSKFSMRLFDVILFPVSRVFDLLVGRLFGKNLFLVAVVK